MKIVLLFVAVAGVVAVVVWLLLRRQRGGLVQARGRDLDRLVSVFGFERLPRERDKALRARAREAIERGRDERR